MKSGRSRKRRHGPRWVMDRSRLPGKSGWLSVIYVAPGGQKLLCTGYLMARRKNCLCCRRHKKPVMNAGLERNLCERGLNSPVQAFPMRSEPFIHRTISPRVPLHDRMQGGKCSASLVRLHQSRCPSGSAPIRYPLAQVPPACKRLGSVRV